MIRDLYIITIMSFLAYGQSDVTTPPVTAEANQQKSSEVQKNKTMEESLKDKKEISGLFKLYQDEKDGKLFMLIGKDQLNKEFIHFVHGLNGQMNAGVMKGGYRGSRIFTLKRYFNRIEFEVQNTAFYYDPNNPLYKSSGSNVSTAILASSTIISEKEGDVLIAVDNLFLTEALHQITRGFIPGGANKNPFKIGRLAKERTKYQNIKNYPENTDLIVQYVYTNPTPTNWGSDKGLTDPRSVNVTLQHSFIKVPENNYIPRFEDPRVGYFTTQVTDLTSPDDPTPYRDLIHRWHLEKKNPDQERSEVKKPIVWWIENTTPHEFRGAIQEGALSWNKAFEKAGLINAIEVKIQPDDADWDAGDIRYNVLRWTSSPNPPFGGYGPSFVNPRTGQILGADIMLEYVYFTNRVKYEKLFETFAEDQNTQSRKHNCNAGEYIQQGNFFGKLVTGSIGNYTELEQHRIIYESLVRLTLHEIGHTHGLNHNFASSYLHSFNNIHDRHITEPIGLTSSVMEYPAVNVGLGPNMHGQFYTTVPGPYDNWAIQFGYTPSLKNPEDEKERVEKLLSQSTKPELLFGNDSDDMRYPGKGIDPRMMIYDLSDDPVAYAQQRMDLVKALYPKLRSRYETKGGSYHSFKDAFYILNREYSQSANIISRQIGGVYIDRSMIGAEAKEEPFTSVSKDQQKWAMTLLNKYVFSPDAFDTPDGIFNYLQSERRGFSGTKDPNILDMYLNMQKNIFNHILNIKVVKRISNAELYGNKYSLSEVFKDLTVACFSSDAGSNVNSMRRNLQVEYAKRLIQVVHNKGKLKYDHLAVAAAYENLNAVKKYASRFNGVDEPTKAHRKYLIYIIEKALKV